MSRDDDNNNYDDNIWHGRQQLPLSPCVQYHVDEYGWHSPESGGYSGCGTEKQKNVIR